MSKLQLPTGTRGSQMGSQPEDRGSNFATPSDEFGNNLGSHIGRKERIREKISDTFSAGKGSAQHSQHENLVDAQN